MKAFDHAHARTLLREFKKRRILVIGDAMLDEFVWGRVSRISPEAPVPVLEVTRESVHLGGAGNVASNIRALGGQATLVSVIGRDIAGARLADELAQADIQSLLIEAQDGRPTTIKTRLIAHHQQLVRADRERSDDLPSETAHALRAALDSVISDCDAIVVSDYQKGLITPRLMKHVVRLARRHDLDVLVDPKVRHFASYRGVTVITPNQLETEQAAQMRIRNDADLERAGAKILKQLRCQALLVTRGEHGMSLFRAGRQTFHIPTFAREVFDVTGAGDTVIATLTLALSAGARIEDAAVLANAAAGVVVGKVGTATASQDEVLAHLAALRHARSSIG
jgi:D-beta-D-heptose 7-phosphate kinase/D-beta-D-heptose 1-phosphate adenosyltransferase